MKLFNKKSVGDGLTGIDLAINGVAALRVTRTPERRAEDRRLFGPERKPRLHFCDFYPYAGADTPEAAVRALAKDHQLDAAACTTVLDGADYKLLLTETPKVETEEMRAALRWRVKDLIDYPIEEATIDVLTVPGEHSNAHEVYVVAARDNSIRERVNLLTDAGVNLQIIDIAEMAQRNIAQMLPEDQQGVALLWLKPRSGLITITKNGELFLSRSLSVGSDDLAGALDLGGLVDTVTLEVQRSLDFFESRFRQPPVRKLVLAPLPREIPELKLLLQENLGVAVEHLDLSSLFQVEGDMPKDWQSRYFITIGAALREQGHTP